jgi:hypothetical protein
LLIFSLVFFLLVPLVPRRDGDRPEVIVAVVDIRGGVPPGRPVIVVAGRVPAPTGVADIRHVSHG